jgi:hypothetical protein
MPPPLTEDDYREAAQKLGCDVAAVKAVSEVESGTGWLSILKNKNWAAFARGYNGKDYKINKYDQKLAAAYKKHGGD